MTVANNNRPAPSTTSRSARSPTDNVPVSVTWSDPKAKAMAAVKMATGSTARIPTLRYRRHDA
jgi:hypothetical protein